ncbi:zinc finger protein 318 isoform X2 [Xyrichtys novacula]|uniref:Zinc finger protein 318 isoform X2 n=2 Tax=Xyrichtys novacula TaxID=13765 RepID=A0AAV1F9A2_XYRNO|nr:zinc finger protein 318 isoform X2 [Xyrichtys novacula]
MYRGRPPRGGYRPPYEGRGPPPRPFNAPNYRDDRNRPKPPYHPGHHDHGHPDSYRRSPPRRRYPSPGSGSHPGGEYWASGPQRERSPSPRGPVPLDHNLVITVGNELTGPPGSAPSRHQDRDYTPRPEYERSRSLGRSQPCRHSRERSPDRSRARSRGRSKSRARSKSRPRSHSRSPDRTRAKSRGRSKSRSPDRSRAKSRGRSKSRSPDRSRAKSRGRSKSCHHTRSRSRSRSRSRGRSYSKAASRGRSRSRYRSRSVSSSSSSSSHSNNSEEKSRKEFKELETARRRKELEEMLSLPTKSILKKRNDSEDSPSLRSYGGVEGPGMSRVADQLLQAVKGMEPHMVASMLSELRSDPQMAHRAGLDAEIKEILNLLGGHAAAAGSKTQTSIDDIDDEEKFLYGDSEEPKPLLSSDAIQHHGLDLYGDVTEEALYGDCPPPATTSGQLYNLPLGAPPHLSAPPTTVEADVRYTSRPSISPDQNITVRVSNPSYPPGTEPLDESERQAVEEYEKIQDLLKTIGLDLGVTEISKMAARTKERLHGNKPPPKTPTRRCYSSGSSDGSRRSRRSKRRSHSGSSSSSSSSRSRSHSRGRGDRRGGSWGSDDSQRKSSALPKSHKDRDVKENKAEQCDTPSTRPGQHIQPIQPLPLKTDPNSLPSLPGVPIPTYPPPQIHTMMPPNYPPPGYGQYGNYLPYMHQQWPPMYPPPMTMPPQSSPDEFPPTQPYDYQTPDAGVKGLGKSSVQGVEKESPKVSSHDRRVSEEQNNESQKQKVLEEREKLKQEREIRMKKKEYLMKELERLRKQQGELLRKKRREKDGHKDPLLQEISRLQEEVMSQISNLRKEHEAAEKKRSEIDKVALILGLNPSDRPHRASKQDEDQEDQQPLPAPPQKKKRAAERSPEGRPEASSSSIKTSVAQSSRLSLEKPPASVPPSPASEPPPSTLPPEPFEYYDAGNHWCKNCNVTSGSMFDFFTHLHSKSHRKTLDPYDRPWASTPIKIIKNTLSEEKLTKPAKGSEFLLPVRGFFCLLCKEFYGDAICAEEHVTTHNHNEKYKKQMYENPLYEQRRNLDRQAGLALETSGKKRKHEDNEKGNKDKEERSKHKKDKKDKEKKREDEDGVLKEEKVKLKKEEQEEKPKPSKKEDDFKDEKIFEEEKPIYGKKDESDKYKFSRKDDKYRYSRAEEEDRHKYDREEQYRYRHHRDGDDRYDDRPKHGPRDDEDRYKHGKYSDSKSKYDREWDEGKPKFERDVSKKPEPEKPTAKSETSKTELPQKPYDLPKVFCGPSPAMRAKLRKQSLEAGKPASVAVTMSFGRFTWKKKENVLAKEAQKAAAEFIKDEEEAAADKHVPVEDSFAKSMAVAQEIAHKLGGPQNTPPPWVSNINNRGRGRGIRPNLPAPAAVTRKTAMMGKPAPFNTFLSIKPQSNSILGPPPPHLPMLKKYADIPNVPVPPQGKCTSYSREQSKPLLPGSGPELSKAKTDPPISEPPLSGKGPAPTVSTVAPPTFTPETPVSIPAACGVKPPQPISLPVPPVTKLSQIQVKPAPPVSKPAETETKAKPVESTSLFIKATTALSSTTTCAPSVAKPPQPTMIKIVSDVAAPGVPESEQTRTVFVKPPPLMKMGEAVQKSEKHKSHLAAAKAKDLFGIFYSGISQSSTSSITKNITDARAEGSSINKSEVSSQQAQNPKPWHESVTQSQPSSAVCTLSHSESNKAPPSPKTLPEKEKAKPSPKTLQEEDRNQVGPKTQPENNQNQLSPNVQPKFNEKPPSPQPIQISSVWSLQSTPAEVAPSKTSVQTNQPILNPADFSKAQNSPPKQSFSSEPASQMDAELPQPSQIQSQPNLTPLNETEPQSEPHKDSQSQSHPETHPDAASVLESKPGRKTRGKTTPTKKTPPAPRPVRQTRSQTRYQTRHQQQQSQSEPEPDLASGDSDSAASDSRGLSKSEPGSGLQVVEDTKSEGGPEMSEITPETLGLPSDMTSLDFEYDFNFE